MQAYPSYGYKQESYVYVEEDDFMKGDYFYDNESNMQIISPNEWISTQPYAPPHRGGYYQQGMKHGKESYWPSDKEQYHHHESWKMDKPKPKPQPKPSHGGGWPNDNHRDSWKMDKPSHGWPNEVKQHHHHESWNMDKPSHGWPNDKEQHHNHDSWSMDKPSHGWSNDREQHHHYDSWSMDKPSHGWSNDKEQHHHHDSWSMDKPSHEGKKHDGGYDYVDDMSHLKIGGSGHHAPPVVLNKQYGDDSENHPYYSEHKKDVLWDFKGIDD